MGKIINGIGRFKSLFSLVLFSGVIMVGTAQGADGTDSSLDLSFVTVNWEDTELREALNDLESKTSFDFLYKDAEVASERVTFSTEKGSLKEVLGHMAKENNLSFERVNQVISVTKNVKEEKKQASKKVSGKITEENGESVPGATVQVKGATIGAITDMDGNYTLSVPEEYDVLVVSFVGYTTQEISVSTRSVIDVQLTPDDKQLDEVVVVGYMAMPKREVSGAVEKFDFKEIENTPIQSFDKAMQGRVAGVQMVNSGVPGGGVGIKVRGTGSFGNTQPLYIVDGQQIVSGNSGLNNDSNGAGATSDVNVMSSINPDDIVSVEVLKDASASIYGAQAANGVVIITTKRGQEGATRFNFNAHWGQSEVVNTLDLMNGPEWTEIVLEGAANAHGVESTEYQTLLSSIGVPENAPTYDWQKLVFQRGLVQNYQLSATGGTEKSKFFVSGNYNNTEGHVIGSGFQRASLRVNLDNQWHERLSGSLSTNLSFTKSDAGGTNGFDFINPTIASAFIVPTNRPYEDDGSIREPLNGLYEANPLIHDHPDIFDQGSKTYRALTSYTFNYEIIKGLNLKSFWSVDFLTNNFDYYISPGAQDALERGGAAEKSNSTDLNWQTDQTLNYANTFGKHGVRAVAGFSYRHDQNSFFRSRVENLSSSGLTALDAGATPNVSGSDTEYKLLGLFGQLQYTFDNRYTMSGTMRQDGSSRFGPAYKYGSFPAVSAAWRVSEESFMSALSSVVDDFKLRGSYGITGNNAIGNFRWRGTFTGGSYLGNGTLQPSVLENRTLRWEESENTNVGLDLSLFGARINLTADVFRKRSNGALINQRVPSTSGYFTVQSNAAEIENKGFEFTLNTVNLDLGGFKWSTNLNHGFVKNEVTSLGNTATEEGEPVQFVFDDDGQIIREGESAYSWYAIRYAGVNPANGLPLYLDKNGDLTYNPTNDDRVIVGGSLPTFFGGLSNDFSYKGIKLSVLFQYQGGNYIRNQLAYSMRASGGFSDRNQDRSQLDRWQEPGDITDVPIAWGVENNYDGRARSGNLYSSRHIEKGDYIRLKQVMLSYDIPSSLLSRVNLRRMTVYASGTNLWTNTPYTGRDPEVLGETESGNYPQAKTYVFGINVGF